MNTDGIVDWAIVAFSLALLALAFYAFGTYLAQVVVRLVTRKRRASWVKWQVERDLYWPIGTVRFTLWGIYHVVAVSLAFFWFLVVAFIIVENPESGLSLEIAPFFSGAHFDITARIAILAFWLGMSLQYVRAWKISEKVKELDGLREVFHQRFSVPEILSIYESFQPAPKLFWEEYTKLPENDINEETNRKFRELVAPYRYSQSRSHNQYISIATAIIIGLTAISASISILG